MKVHRLNLVNDCCRLAVSRAVLATLIVLVSVSCAIAARHERLIDSWKPLNYNVSITFNERLTELTTARTEITVLSLKDTLSRIDLDFGELIVDSITVDGEPAPFQRSTDILTVNLPQAMPRDTRFVVVVSYHGKPKDGLILGADKSGRPSAIGDNWPNRLHHWVPCLDHPSAKATVSFKVNAPARDLVVANGKLNRIESTSKTTRTWSYTESVPIPPYCMIIAVGEFDEVLMPLEKGMTPLSYYVPRADRNFAVRGFAAAIPSLKFFTETVADYPYEKLALIIGATRFGGMENSSAIVFSNTLFNPRPNEPISRVFKIREGLVEIVAHEIAHQWFGDSVTESTWADLWLSEGFATYFAGLFIQRHQSEEAFQEYMAEGAETYLNYEKKKRIPLHDTETENLFAMLNANNYQKGAWVLHMLRAALGDKAFFQGVRDYYNSHKNATANSEDLRLALEKSSGTDLRPFFKSWIYGSGHPYYELSWEWNRKLGVAKLLLKQLQPEPPFPNVLPVIVTTANGPTRVLLKPAGRQTVKELPLTQAPLSVQIDPENSVLKEVKIKNPDPKVAHRSYFPYLQAAAAR
jgi:aminopeptidase N